MTGINAVVTGRLLVVKMKEYASESESSNLRNAIIEQKKRHNNCTYDKLANYLGQPCTGGTLQQCVRYPRRPLAKEVYDKISDAIEQSSHSLSYSASHDYHINQVEVRLHAIQQEITELMSILSKVRKLN